jgi:transketolase|tara:strand:- start:230 stop:847 length:618 start_codon:yes stop_codon:yes gene_type:complete
MKDLYKRLLNICYERQLHHLGSYFSALQIIDQIYSEMDKDDIFILSNGHAVVALYVILEKYYGLDAVELHEKYGDHPKRNELDKLHCSTGSLGMGVTVAVGRALANPDRDVYCLLSDGECAEGSVWEALRFAYENKVTNLKLYVNANGWSAYDTVDLDYLENRIKAFHPDVNYVRTTVEHFGLKGLHAHYTNFNEEQYKEALASL